MIEPLIAIQRLAAGAQFRNNNNGSGGVGGQESLRSPTHAFNQETFDDDRDFIEHRECTENVPAQIFDYRNEKVAGFNIHGRHMICLPQVYELFLKQLVGGLHTVYTKLKRLGIQPLICNVEQVRALRSLGAIQPGVNRCKLIDKDDCDKLYDDCTNSGSRPGRPPKRTPTDEWSQLIIKKERLDPEMAPSTSTIVNPPPAPPPDVLEAQQASPNASSASAAQMQHLFGNLLSPMTAQQLLMQQMMAVAMASQTQSHNIQNSSRPITQLSEYEWSQTDDSSMVNEQENGCKIFVETTSHEFNTRPCSSENAAPLNLTKFQDNTPKNFLSGPSERNEREKSSTRSVDTDNGNGKTPPGNNSETDDSFDREKSISLSNDRSGSSSQRSPSETDQTMQFVVSKISSLVEAAENSFKSHYEKLNILTNALQTELKEMKMREVELEKKYSEECHRASIYFRRYTLMKHKALHLKRKMSVQQQRPIASKKRTEPMVAPTSTLTKTDE